MHRQNIALEKRSFPLVFWWPSIFTFSNSFCHKKLATTFWATSKSNKTLCFCSNTLTFTFLHIMRLFDQQGKSILEITIGFEKNAKYVVQLIHNMIIQYNLLSFIPNTAHIWNSSQSTCNHCTSLQHVLWICIRKISYKYCW